MAGGLEHFATWVGEPPNPIGAKAKYSPDFAGHLYIWETCNRLPLAAGADWRKAAQVASEAILHAVEDEERTSLEGALSVLDKLVAQEFKGRRLGLSIPFARHFITNPRCIHTVRNSLEIVRSLQVSEELLERLDSLGATDIEQLSEELIKKFLDPHSTTAEPKGRSCLNSPHCPSSLSGKRFAPAGFLASKRGGSVSRTFGDGRMN